MKRHSPAAIAAAVSVMAGAANAGIVLKSSLDESSLNAHNENELDAILTDEKFISENRIDYKIFNDRIEINGVSHAVSPHLLALSQTSSRVDADSENAYDITDTGKYMRVDCYDNCHSNCHGSRAWR